MEKTDEKSPLTGRDWVDRARETFEPGERSPCSICGKYHSLTQAHHIIPLAHQAERSPLYANHDHVWLCPTHHVAVHALIDQICIGDVSKYRGGVILDLASDEKELLAIDAIAKRAFA